jgi:hypothetical protein
VDSPRSRDSLNSNADTHTPTTLLWENS